MIITHLLVPLTLLPLVTMTKDPDSCSSVRADGVELSRDRILELEERVKDLEDALAQVSSAKVAPPRPRSDQVGQNRVLHTMDRKYPDVPFLNYRDRKRILITGGSGFVGSHLVDRLMLEGHEVTVADNMFTGRKKTVEHWIGHPNFELINHDVVNPIFLEVDEIYHLASPASPPHYMYNPVKTIKTNTMGTINMLGLAKRVEAKILIASTSEVYGDPEVHPQDESYWGHVNPIGPRACYDEGKRVAETLAYAYEAKSNVQVRVARIFNTYGPRMHMQDGRVVSNFVLQALQGQPITVNGDGKQTRSFQYVSDLVDGLVLLMNSNYTKPVNIGNPNEFTIIDFAKKVVDFVAKMNRDEGKEANPESSIVHLPPVEDDPQRRRPNIDLAKRVLDWQPKVTLEEGLLKTVKYFKGELERKTIDLTEGYDVLW